MNESRTRRIGAGIRTAVVTFVLATLCVALTSPAFSAQPLGTLISDGGFDWMAGTWVATNSRGGTVEFTYKWAIENHVISVEYEFPNDFTYRGLIFYKATETKIVHIGADNQGGVWEGTWDSDGRRAILSVAHTRADGQIQKVASANSWVDADTMKVQIYLIQNGEMDDEPMETVTFKRKKSAQKAGK
jgi:YD repeat-containing protein